MNASKQQRVLQAIAQALSGQAALVPGLYSDFLPETLRGRERDFFVYATDALDLSAGETASPTINIQDDSHFLAVATAGVATDPATPSTTFDQPAITVQINDSGSGRNLQNRAMHWQNVVGTAQLPMFFPYPKLINRASTITTTFANLHASQAYDIRLNYLGFKIFAWKRGV